MSRQLAFSSTISIMVMAAFALSATVKAQDVAPPPAFTQAPVLSGR